MFIGFLTTTDILTTGMYEPTDTECDWPSEDEDDELADEVKDKVRHFSYSTRGVANWIPQKAFFIFILVLFSYDFNVRWECNKNVFFYQPDLISSI